jgi:hypothetical protein
MPKKTCIVVILEKIFIVSFKMKQTFYIVSGSAQPRPPPTHTHGTQKILGVRLASAVPRPALGQPAPPPQPPPKLHSSKKGYRTRAITFIYYRHKNTYIL